MKRVETEDTLHPEHDLSALTVVARGPGRVKPESIELAADVAEVFPTEESVNEALRFFIQIG